MTKKPEHDPELEAMIAENRPLMVERIKQLDREIRAYEADELRRRARLRRLTLGFFGR